MPTGWGLPRTAFPGPASARSAPGLPTPTPSTPCWTTGTRTPAPASSSPGAVIARCFSGDSVEGIVERLRSERGAAATWAQGVVEELGGALADLAQDHPPARQGCARARPARHADAGFSPRLPVPGGARSLRGRARAARSTATAPPSGSRRPGRGQRGHGRAPISPPSGRRARASEPRRDAGVRTLIASHRGAPDFAVNPLL